MRPEGTTTSIVLFLIIFAVMAADMWGDRATGASGLHLLAEAIVLVLSAVFLEDLLLPLQLAPVARPAAPSSQ